MTVPPWKSDDPVEQRAFMQFVLAELNRLDTEIAHSTLDTDTIGWFQKRAEVQRLAPALGLKIEGPKPRDRRKALPPSDPEFTDFDRAALDVKRIRLIFYRVWKRRNRYRRPLAEEIAAERWELSATERAALIDKFQRKSAVSK